MALGTEREAKYIAAGSMRKLFRDLVRPRLKGIEKAFTSACLNEIRTLFLHGSKHKLTLMFLEMLSHSFTSTV